KPSSGRYVAAANVDGRLAIPIQPKEPSCQAISIQVSIISWNDGSTPPAALGLNAGIRSLAHICSTIAGDSVRRRSDSAASPRTRSRIPRARSITDTSTTTSAPLGLPPSIIGDKDRFASLFGFRPYLAGREDPLVAPRPMLHPRLFGGPRLGFRLLSRLEGVRIFVFLVLWVVIDLEEDLVPPLVGLHPRFDVT